jgi:hypothetical protein
VTLFPGALKLALALAGFALGPAPRGDRRFTAFLLATASRRSRSLLPGFDACTDAGWLRSGPDSQVSQLRRVSMLMRSRRLPRPLGIRGRRGGAPAGFARSAARQAAR